LRIALVAPLSPPPGGISTWTDGLLRFALQDPDVKIVHVDSAVRYRAVANLTLAMRAIGGFVHAVALFGKYAKALLFAHIDVAHICVSGSLGAHRDLVLAAFTRFWGIPLVVHLRFGRVPELVASENWEAALIRGICRLATDVIVLDSASAESLRRLVPGCSVSVIPNPAWKVDKVRVAAVDGGEAKVIVFAGHVVPSKGVRELVLACRDIEDSEFRLDVIGPVMEGFREELQALACTRADGAWLNISGAIDGSEVLGRIACGFAVVLPSYTEGFPNAVLEAMMLGRPVVATPVGAIPQMLSFGGTKPCGISVPVGDTDALRIAIQSLLKQPSYALELGRHGRERVVRAYSPRAVYLQYKSIWDKSAARTRSSSS
jgi:glycosyltransferase involved in cell wall biosynthesis